jgi:FSR family fosmidomycin resistance protein-like MFS transporter
MVLVVFGVMLTAQKQFLNIRTAGPERIIGLVLASAFSAILVYAQELIPSRVGLISGIFFGFAFGMGGIGSAALGRLADLRGIDYVFHVCSFLPLLGLLAAFLPDPRRNAALA